MYKIVNRSFLLFLFVVSFGVAWMGVAQAAPSRQLVIKGDRAFPPYEFINEQGKPDGFNVELMRAVMKKAGMPYTLSLDDWPQVVKEFKEGKVDVITGIMYSNRRAEIFKFGAIHTFVYQNVIYRKGGTPITELEELKGLNVIVQDGAITQEILKETSIQAQVIVVPDLYQGLRMLSEGKYDVALCNAEMAFNIINKQKLNNLEMSELNLPPDEYCFAGKSDSLLTVIDKAFYQLQREGEYDRLFNKWFSTPIHRIPQWVYLALGVLLLVVIIGYLFIIVLRKQVKKANKEIRLQNQKLSLAIKDSNIAYWEFDPLTNTFNAYNDPVNDYNEARSITPNDYYRCMDTSDKLPMQSYLEMMLEGRDESYTLDIRMKTRHDKEWRNCTITGTPFAKDPLTKRVTKYVGFRQDNTDLILTQQKLEHEMERALQSDKMKSAFLANMSHEIRTPLNAIVGFSGLLQDTNDPQERKEYIQIINTNNELLLNLINDILDLSRIESGEVTLANECFDLVHYFGNLATSLQQRCVNPEVRFIIESPYTNCNVFLDRNRLAQICTNFATNAIKHTQKGYIKIGYAYVDGGISLYVEDTGNGIPADKQHLVFQRFEKLNPFVQGTGLGLSICKAIVDAYAGKIGFTSKEGQGSRFWAWIPCEVEGITSE